MELKSVHTMYMLGIGGIGMSALARFFHRQGVRVTGYDKTPSPLTEALCAEGIPVHYDEDAAHIPVDALYVFTPAVPNEHPAFSHVERSGGKWYKRSEVLEAITKESRTIAIAGTHGKTTTTAISAHLMHCATQRTSAFVGGIMTNYHSNLIAAENPEFIVVEADEYDRSFLRLHPDVAVVTSLDPDHLDIYGSFESMKEDYRSFATRAQTLIVHESIASEFDHPNKKVYGRSADSDWCYGNVSVQNGRFGFSMNGVTGYQLSLAGRHNVENAVAAMAACEVLGEKGAKIQESLSEFKGVKRRFERVLESDEVVLIDDYAHHPEEINAAIRAARELYPNRKLTVVFQPHLYSRTRDLEEGFVRSLNAADEVVLMPIYPARERPIDGVSSVHLLNKLTLKTKHLAEKSDLINTVLSLTADVVLILGAGDIDRFVDPLAEALRKRTHVE